MSTKAKPLLMIGEQANNDSVIDGATLKVFYQQMWPEGVYIDDLLPTIEDECGVWIMQDDATVRLYDIGLIGANDCQAFKPFGWNADKVYSPVELWNKVMANVEPAIAVSLKIPPSQLEALLQAAEELGATIISPAPALENAPSPS